MRLDRDDRRMLAQAATYALLGVAAGVALLTGCVVLALCVHLFRAIAGV